MTTHERRVKTMTAAFDLRGLDRDDPDAVERRWNDWVRGLFERGWRPGEEPLSSSDDELVYDLYAVGGLRDTAGYALAAGEAVVPTLAVA
jgi:hypothetical protein